MRFGRASCPSPSTVVLQSIPAYIWLLQPWFKKPLVDVASSRINAVGTHLLESCWFKTLWWGNNAGQRMTDCFPGSWMRTMTWSFTVLTVVVNEQLSLQVCHCKDSVLCACVPDRHTLLKGSLCELEEYWTSQARNDSVNKIGPQFVDG